MNNGNPYQTRIGQQTPIGPFFPHTNNGDQIGAFASPARFAGNAFVGLLVNNQEFHLTPEEARALADVLRFHADQSDE